MGGHNNPMGGIGRVRPASPLLPQHPRVKVRPFLLRPTLKPFLTATPGTPWGFQHRTFVLYRVQSSTEEWNGEQVSFCKFVRFPAGVCAGQCQYFSFAGVGPCWNLPAIFSQGNRNFDDRRELVHDTCDGSRFDFTRRPLYATRNPEPRGCHRNCDEHGQPDHVCQRHGDYIESVPGSRLRDSPLHSRWPVFHHGEWQRLCARSPGHLWRHADEHNLHFSY